LIFGKIKFDSNQMSESDYSWLASAADELGMRDFAQQVRESKPNLTEKNFTIQKISPLLQRRRIS
jgi:hypothetical protein